MTIFIPEAAEGGDITSPEPSFLLVSEHLFKNCEKRERSTEREPIEIERYKTSQEEKKKMSRKSLVFVTGNQNKLKEVSDLMNNSPSY